MQYEFKKVHGHYEVYEKNGKFILSEDTYKDAVNSLIEHLSSK